MSSLSPFETVDDYPDEEHRRREDGPDEDDDERTPVGLTLLAGAVAATVVIPVVWIGVVALSVDLDRAASIVLRRGMLDVLLNTVVLIVAVTTLSVLIAVPLAFLTVLTDLPFKRFWIVALSLPLVVPSFVSAFSFVSVWGPQGRLQSVLAPLGVESLPEIYGMPGTVFVLTLYNYPFVYLTTIAGLRALDKTYVDAARSLETGIRGVFVRIVLPMVKPAIAAGALLTALETAGDFGVPAILRLSVFTRQIYLEYNALAHDYAAMLSLHLVAITLVILLVESQVRSHERIHGSARGNSGPYTIRLGRWRWPALIVPAAIVALAILVPVGFLFSWLVTGPDAYAGSFGFEPGYAINSVYVSALAAAVAACLALPVAYLAARHPAPLSGTLERATYVGFAVPGVVIGLSLVYFATRYLPSVYQTVPLVVFAYVVLYLPLAVGSTRAAILYVNPQFVEAARSLGNTPFQAFRRITLPLVFPGVVAGAALVFLHGMKELPATLLLRPIGFDTLATFIWAAERNAYYGYAAVPALVLVFISGLSILGVVSREYPDTLAALRKWRRNRGDAADVGEEPFPGPDGTGDRAVMDGGTTVDAARTGSRAGSADNEGSGEREVVLELEDVRKRYDGRPAVDGISLSVRRGEILTLLGPSGCGKTTTLRLIDGLERPGGGTIRIDGETVADGETYRPAEERDVGIVFQEFALFPHKTIAENVAFGLEDAGNEERADTVAELLELVGLSAYRDSYPNELSGGQKQRVALARSLAPRPEVLLLDEPLSNLDAGLRARMRNSVQRILEEVDVTAVWVTHNQEEALSVGDRTAVMNAGRIEQLASPRALYMEPASRMVADFLGRGDYLHGRLENGVVETPLGAFDADRVSLPENEQALEVLVRPDDVAITPSSTGDGRVVGRQFNGETVRYRIEVEGGERVSSRQSHDDWYDVGTSVDVSVTATHALPAFPRA
ncbi:ABC transporter [Natronococcus amylolyticus DSM 10524]|uniref:Molybdate/tungstate import ATP-binding protein WtpC n=1 Tax=Natronococcus amylolyticus DSM 10524 TaxID=1227497 RepID=L9X8D7_9EURY|nr:ATP-binding cassette domain-containing protein [Natronococcus amylolyticus]ELY57989.1 ABC transporter [Natronococcus amylolyticus DSM 10524]